MEMFAAIEHTAAAIGAPRAESGARLYRTLPELVALLAPYGEVETGELDVVAGYADFDDFWSALERQVGPAGAWLKGLDDDRRRAARGELHRYFGGPGGPFELQGRAFAVRVTPA